MKTEDFNDALKLIREGALIALPDYAERRRYELLRSATQIYCMGVTEGIDDWTFAEAVHEAEAMLAAIEKAEAQ